MQPSVLAWHVSITMEADFYVGVLEDALSWHGKPDIFNTDQGSPFPREAFTSQLLKNEIAISMDGKDAWRDNVFVERLWRPVKYEDVYIRAYDMVDEAGASIGRYRTSTTPGGRIRSMVGKAGSGLVRQLAAAGGSGMAAMDPGRAQQSKTKTAERPTYRN